MDTAPHPQRKVRVEMENVSLAYGKTQVLRDVSVNIEPGEFFALLGPSGSGKSTLLRMLAGFSQPQSGSIKVDGADIVRRTAAALELVGLAEYGARRPNQLSGGQQQRVAVARTIAIEPKVLLLDEPLSNLDAKLRVHMRVELLALQRKLGITTIFVTHDQEEALSIADRVAVLDAGVIQQVGTPTELFDRPLNRFIAGFIGTINLLPGTVTAGRFTSPQLGTVEIAIMTATDGPAELAIRPHALSVIEQSATPSAGRAWLAGTVMEREFLGEFMRYRVDVAGSLFIADVPHFGGSSVAVGTPVQLGIDPAMVTVLPRV
jgi:iron(III) transport system ATP-binding protein